MQGTLAQVLFNAQRSMPLAVGFALAAVLATAWLYPVQLKAVRRPWRWLMPLLRVTAFVALAIALLQPAMLRPRTVEEAGAVVVLVDKSRSMSIVDAARTPAQRVALAAALGKLPANLRTQSAATTGAALKGVKQLANTAIRARNELDYAALAGRSLDGAKARLKSSIEKLRAAAGQLPSLKPLQDEIDALKDDAPLAALTDRAKQIDAAAAGITASQTAADEALYNSNAEVHAAADAVGTLSRSMLASEAMTGTGGVVRALPRGTPVYSFTFDSALTQASGAFTTSADGLSTDIDGVLRSIGGQLDRLHLQAILLVSDGRQVGGASASRLVARGDATAVPVFAIDTAGAVPPDVSIASVDFPDRVYVGESATAHIEVRSTSPAIASVEVAIESKNKAVAQSQSVALSDGRGAMDVTIKFPSAAIEQLKFVAKPSPQEATIENNSAEKWVKVVSGKFKAATISPAPSWDFQYFRNALSRTPGIELTDLLTDDAAATKALTRDSILAQSAIVLGDVPRNWLSSEQWDAVLELVTKRGGSVVVLANDLDVVRQYESDPRLAALLPYRSGLQASWQIWPGRDAAFNFVASGESRLLQLPKGRRLPGLYRYLALPELKATSRALLVERNSRTPVVTASRIGAGQVVFVGMNETWRWRRGVGEQVQDQYWLELLRQSVEQPFAVQTDTFSLDVTPLVAAPGQPIALRARVTPADAASASNAPRVRITRYGETIDEATLSPLASPGRFEMTYHKTLEPGAYEVVVTTAQGSGETLTCPLQIVAPTARRELADVSGDPVHLRQIAETTGGKYIPIDEIGSIPKDLSQIREKQSALAEYTLWDSPYLFAFVLACLGGEWALRKRFGLA